MLFVCLSLQFMAHSGTGCDNKRVVLSPGNHLRVRVEFILHSKRI